LGAGLPVRWYALRMALSGSVGVISASFWLMSSQVATTIPAGLVASTRRSYGGGTTRAV
jgi:hypothetical protein